MAQGISMRGAYLEYSLDNTTWNDFSGYAISLSKSGGSRKTGEENVFGQEGPVVTLGKKESSEYSVKCLYTEGTNDIFTKVQQAYENSSQMYLRWAPLGNSTGNKRYTTGAGWVLEDPYPVGDAADGKPISFVFKIKFTGNITPSTIP